MKAGDDSEGAMDDELTDDQIERLLSGAETPDGYGDVADLLAAMRTSSTVGTRSDTPAVGAASVSAALGEFVGSSSAAPADADITLVAAPAASTTHRRSRMLTALAGSTVAKLAVTGGVTLAAVTGAHATGLVDVPLLPDDGEAVEVVLANESTAAPASGSDPSVAGPAAAAQSSDDDGDTPAARAGDTTVGISLEEDGIRAQLGDVSLTLSIASVDGGLTVDIDVEGVSSACETALEALEDVTDPDQFATALDAIEPACADDFAGLIEQLGQLEFGLDDFMGPDGIPYGFGGELDPEQLERFFDEQIVPFLGEDFDPESFLDPEQLEQFLDDLGEGGMFVEGGIIPFLGEDFDLDQLDEFFGDFENFDPGQFFGDLENFDLEEFFGGSIPWLDENFDPQQLDEFFGDLENFDLDEFYGDLEKGLPGFFDDLLPEDELGDPASNDEVDA